MLLIQCFFLSTLRKYVVNIKRMLSKNVKYPIAKKIQVSYCKININCSLLCGEQPSASHMKHYFGNWRASCKADYNQQLMWRSSDSKQNMEQVCLLPLWPPLPWYIGVTGSFSQCHISLESLSFCWHQYRIWYPRPISFKIVWIQPKTSFKLKWIPFKVKSSVFLVPKHFASEEIWTKIFKEVFLFLCASYIRKRRKR